jgi:hypothetical protein
MNKLQVAIVIAVACISGCTTVYRTAPADTRPAQVASDEIDLVPPVPSFSGVMDCELAYGVGACGTAAAVYETAGIAVPVGASEWYIPFAFGVMTGVLVNNYFAPPGVYVADFQYRSFTSTTVIDSYKTINQTTISNYRQAPASARNQAVRSGPVRYSKSRGAVTGPARLAGSASSHTQSSPSTRAASAPAQRMNPNTTATSQSSGATMPSTASTYAPPAYNASRQATPPARSTPGNTPLTRTAAPANTPPGMAHRNYTSPTRQPAAAATPARTTQPNYTSPRPATTRSAPQNNASKSCKSPPCR